MSQHTQNLARLTELAEIVKTAYQEYHMSKRNMFDKAMLIGQSLSEAKTIIGSAWYSWAQEKVGMPRRNAYRYLSIYEGVAEGSIQIDDWNKVSIKGIEILIEKRNRAKAQGKAIPVTELTSENQVIAVTAHLPRWLHERLRKHCKVNKISLQNFYVDLIENYFEEIDRQTTKDHEYGETYENELPV